MARAGRGRWFCIWQLAVTVFAVGCATPSKPAQSSSESAVSPLDFSLAGLDGEPLDAAEFRGRVTVLLFVTTFDIPSQAQAKRLQDLHRTHVPRINAVGVILEAPRYVELARSYREVLGLSYPLGMVDKESLEKHPQLHHVSGVPAWIFLDREGKIRSAASGPLTPSELEERLRSIE